MSTPPPAPRSVTILHMIGAALSREQSFQSSWNNSGQIASSDALSKARKRLPLSIWDKLDQWINGNIEYKKRWEVETLIKEQKIWLGSDILRSKTSEDIAKEIYARIIAGNLIHWLILKASQKHNVEATRISITTATRLINHYSIRMSEATPRRLPYLYEELLEKIAASIIPYRPDRSEPRFKRRDQKHYSILHTARSQWRRENALA